jgi:hypothetical protein
MARTLTIRKATLSGRVAEREHCTKRKGRSTKAIASAEIAMIPNVTANGVIFMAALIGVGGADDRARLPLPCASASATRPAANWNGTAVNVKSLERRWPIIVHIAAGRRMRSELG